MERLDERATAPGGADVLAGGGEMGALMRAVDWAGTPLGAVETWPQSLRTAVSICLASRFPMLIWWGPELVMLYNDAYRPMLGATKHPRAMGQRGRECWPEIWDVIGPMLNGVLATGVATWSDDQLLLLDRNGYVEECYFTFSYSPIRDETGGIGGVFTAVTETTDRVLGERRMATLRALAARTAEAKSAEDICTIAAAVLAENAADVPFALLYLLDVAGTDARLAAATGLDAGTAASPWQVDLADSDEADEHPAPCWPLARAARTGQAVLVDDLPARFGPLSIQPDVAAPTAALILPVAQAGQERPAALLVAGVSPQRALDDDYRGFFDLVAGQIATAIANARAYQEERKRAEALAELDRAKTLFFSNVSHEFRTPLTLALGPVEDMLADPTEHLSAQGRERLEIVHRNSLRLLKLVNTLLDFSRIEAGRAQANYEPTDLAAYTAELAGVFRSAVERAGLHLLVDCPALPEPVYVDREMWEKVVLNLLSNALKFTLEGEIAVRLRSVGDRVELEVCDTGTGIPPAELPHIFERFHRVRDARRRTHEGTGIGLSLVRELVRLHGGDVRAESVEGAGTTFTVALPLGTAHLPPERIGATHTRTSTVPGAAPYVEEALRWLPDAGLPEPAVLEWPAGRAARPGDGTLAPAPASARVLLADDNADMRAYLRRLLGERYAVEAVADGNSALASARTQPPDLVLADVMMPGLDGFALLRALRADPRTRDVPIILLSARAGEEARMEGLDAGADDYLVKPFSARELLARVEAHLRLAQVRAQAMETERVLRAQAEAERARLRELFQVAPAMIAVLAGPDHVFEAANEFYQRGAGRGADDLIGRSIREALPELEGQGFYDLLDEVYRSGTPYVGEEILVRLDRDGDGLLEDAYFTFTYQPLRDVAGAVEGILVLAVDVTAQAQARQYTEELAGELRAERDRLQQILDALPVGVVIAEAPGRFTTSNLAATAMFGPGLPDRPVPRSEMEAYEAYGACRLDGTPYPSNDLPLQRALWRGEVVRGEQFLIRAAMGRTIPVLANTAPLRDAVGAIVGAVGVFQDITELRDLERAREEFLSSAAHDLKTPLTGIRGQAQLARRRLARLTAPDTEPIIASLGQIDSSTERMLTLINELVDVTRVQMGVVLELDRRPCDLVALVRGVVAQQGSAPAHRIEMETALPALDGVVDAARVERVVANLLSNALKYSPEGGPITIRIAREDGATGPEAVIAVRDRGIGIPARDLPYIFDRFRRAGNVAGHIQGTGIGLASARHIVEQHGGTIAAESVEGEGSTFTVRLPLSPA